MNSETQSLLDGLVERLPTARLLLLVNYRPEYQHGWGAKTYYTQVRLDPLPEASAEQFLQVLLGQDLGLGSLKQLLIARTEGNPFFLEESVRALSETGGLEGERGTYRLARQVAEAMEDLPQVGTQRGLVPPTKIQVPATVQAVLAARIDRLLPDEKRLLQTAAVIGNDISLALLHTISALPEELLHRCLAHLQAAEFLYETRLFPEQEFTFKHALTQEVAYDSLLLERRRGLHARIVEAMEGLAPERLVEQVERLAHHALRGELWDKAVTYCQRAGARANDRAAFREAVAAFDQSLQALLHLPKHNDTRVLATEIRLALGGALTRVGEYRQCLTLLGDAEALATGLNDRSRLGLVLAEMARVLRQTGDSDGAIAAGQKALELAVELGDSTLQVHASHTLGQAYNAVGAFGRAADLLRRNVEEADRETGTPSTDVRIQSRAWLARILGHLGAFAEGQRHGAEALRLATLNGRGITLIIAYGCLGHLYLIQGDLEHALRVLEQSLALCRASGNRSWFRAVATSLGYTSALQGRLAEGCALLEEGISEGTRAGALQNQAYWLAWLSEVHRMAGRSEAPWQHARHALDLARRYHERANEALALHQMGVVYAHITPPGVAQAETYYQQALALAEELAMRPLQAHCHGGLGSLYAKAGRREQACCELSIAVELYRTMQMTFWLPQAEAALAEAT
jgi:tetratricopeptide (TPR) repeat protein